MSIRRMMLFTLGGFFKSIISLFKTRVLNDGGTFEAETNLENQLNALGSNLFDSASLVITPNGVKTSKLYSIKPNDGTADLTVVRNTSATRIDENGNIVNVPANVARIDYSNGSPSILVEPQRTNLLLRSEEFDNGYWFKSNGVITINSTIAPNGTMTADLFTKTSAINTISSVTRVNAYLTTGIRTLSVFVKPNVGNLVLLRLDAGGSTASTRFNFDTKTFTNTGANIISSSFKEFPNGWFRLTITGNVISTNWVVDVCNLFYNPTGDAMWIWGAQLEQGSNATSYIPTTTSSVTRNADVISKSGISSLIGQTEGTMYWEGFLNRNSSTERLIAISGSTISNRAVLNINNNRIEFINRSNNTNVNGNINGSSLSEIQNGLNKIAVRYQSGNTALYVNGVLVNLDTRTFNYTSTIDRLFLVSSEINPSNINNASIKLAILSSTILNNQQLQQLTTL